MKFDWTFLHKINSIILLKRVSIFTSILVPVLASIWLFIETPISDLQNLAVSLKELNYIADSTNNVINTISKNDLVNNLIDKNLIIKAQDAFNSIKCKIENIENQMIIFQFRFPISLTLAFFASIAVIIANILFNIGFPSELKIYNKEEYSNFILESGISDTKIEEYKKFLKDNKGSVMVTPAHIKKEDDNYKNFITNLIKDAAPIEYEKLSTKNYIYIILCILSYSIGIILIFSVIVRQIVIVIKATF